MKLFALFLVVFNFSVFAGFDYSFKCKNSAALDNGMILELNNEGEAVLTYKSEDEVRRVFLTSLSKTRTEIHFKSDQGTFITAKMKNGNLSINNLDETIQVNYSQAFCSPL
jgi:hypothetical protein